MGLLPNPDDSASPTDAAGRCAEQVMGEYCPVAVWCDRSTFLAGGVRACLKE